MPHWHCWAGQVNKRGKSRNTRVLWKKEWLRSSQTRSPESIAVLRWPRQPCGSRAAGQAFKPALGPGFGCQQCSVGNGVPTCLHSTWCTSFFTARQAGSSSAVRSHSSTCAAKSDGRALNPPFDSSERSANQSRQAGSRCREGSSSGVATATLMSRSATLPQPNRTHFGRHALTALPVLHPASVRPCPARTWLARLAASTWSLSLVTCTSSKWVLSLLSAPYKHGTH